MEATGSDQPNRLDATPNRVQRIAELLEGRDAEARVLHNQHAGPVRSGSRPDAVMVGAVEIVVPANAYITTRAKNGQLGIDVNSDNNPEPPGTWIWIGCDAVEECHHIFSELASA